MKSFDVSKLCISHVLRYDFCVVKRMVDVSMRFCSHTNVYWATHTQKRYTTVDEQNLEVGCIRKTIQTVGQDKRTT